MRPIDADELLKIPYVRKVTEFDETGCGISYLAVPIDDIYNFPKMDCVVIVKQVEWKETGCNALAYIQQLESLLGLQEAATRIAELRVAELESRLAQVERERDAAVSDLTNSAP